jgi:hypothetical protein
MSADNERPYYLNEQSCPKVTGDSSPATSTDFLPPECARIMVEENRLLQCNEARRLLHSIYNDPKHEYWKGSATAWHNAVTVLTALAEDD